MDKSESGPDLEFAAIQSVFAALERLDGDSRKRVLDYIAARLGISISAGSGQRSLHPSEEGGVQPELDEIQASPSEFATFAELHDAASPVTDKDRVLVASYWLQICEGQSSFVSYAVNKALKDLGHGVTNVTVAFSSLKGQKPALVLQLKKSGKSRQARKTYKVTNAGVSYVKAMIDG